MPQASVMKSFPTYLRLGPVLLLLSCAPQPVEVEPRAESRGLLFRLTEELARGPLPGSVRRCQVSDEFRPALGCLPRIEIARLAPTSGAQPRTEISMPIPPSLLGRAFILGATLKGKQLLEWREMRPRLVGRGAKWIRAPLDQGNILDGKVWARPIPPAYQHHRTRPLILPANARLEVATAMDEVARALQPGAARLRVEIESASERKAVLSTRVPGDRPHWEEHTIDLSEFAGKEVVFHFISTLVAESEPGAFTAPLWGSPTITAPVQGAGKPNILVLSLDTLRADYVGMERKGRSLTPNLDRLRARSTVFQNAMTTYPSTTASHMSLFTGLYPASHGTNHAGKRLPEWIPTIATTLAADKYATAAVTENAMLNAQSGFMRGFDSYREQKSDDVWSSAGAIQKTFDDGLAWLQGRSSEPFFLFLHTYQVHYPYTPPPEYDLFRDDPDVPLPEDKAQRNIIESERAYAAEVLYTDAQVGRLLDALESGGSLENTIVLVTSDHGEEFGEHGAIGHSHALHAEVLNIPMSLFFPPIAPPGHSIETPVSLVDVLPTLLDILELPSMESDGRSLRPLLEGNDFGEPRAIYAQNFSEKGSQWAARTSSHKFIFEGEDLNPVAVYDLRFDPGEQDSLDDEELAREGRQWVQIYKDLVIENMTAAMERDAASRSDGATEPAAVDADLANKLRALGYAD